jgi:translation elongation factor EF-Ts
MDISTELVKDLRQRTGAGVIDCRTALQEANTALIEARNLTHGLSFPDG